MGMFSSRNAKKRQHGSLILLLMLLAFALKAVLPAGFMPEHKNGLMALVICSGMGEKTIFVPEDRNSPEQQNHQDNKAEKPVCAYQALASGKVLVPAPVAALAAPAVLISHDLPADEHRLFAALSRSFEARGPPHA